MNEQRRIEAQIEVPGTPELVWEAIATGPGIAAWFMPLEIEGREGGTVYMDFGAGVEATGKIRAGSRPTASSTRRARGSRASGSWRRALAAPAWCGW